MKNAFPISQNIPIYISLLSRLKSTKIRFRSDLEKRKQCWQVKNIINPYSVKFRFYFCHFRLSIADLFFIYIWFSHTHTGFCGRFQIAIRFMWVLLSIVKFFDFFHLKFFCRCVILRLRITHVWCVNNWFINKRIIKCLKIIISNF